MFNQLVQLKDTFLDIIFPRFCVGCGMEGSWLCADCKKAIILVHMQVCPECGRLSEKGRYCPRCRYEKIKLRIKNDELRKKKTKIIKKTKPLCGIIAATYYEEGPIREMIHNFKYNGVTELSDELAKVLYQALSRYHCVPKTKQSIKIRLPRPRQARSRDDTLEFDIITFVPLHPRRLAQRGFNQAEILAQKIAEKTTIECLPLLKRTKHRLRQVQMTAKKRRENLKGVFELRSKKYEEFKNKRILIIDDIATTGTTLNECARALKEAGAKEIWGLVVARG